MNKNDQSIERIEFLKGALDLLILETLRWGPQHGYGIGQAIKGSTRDELKVDNGTLYPAMHRLERRKWVSSTWSMSPHKQRVKVYAITALGKKQLKVERTQWERFSDAVGAVLSRFRETQC
jgi:transcriptional regulator